MTRLKRRLINTSTLLVFSVLALFAYNILSVSLRNTALYTGALLLFLVLLLTCFNSRKKISFFPLMKVSTWTQIHIYMGYFCAFVFLLHVDFEIPQGRLEQVLAASFVIVTFSGLFGLIISRWLPTRITASGETLTYERIPAYRKEVRQEAEALVLKSQKEADSSSLGDLYISHIDKYFRARPGIINAFTPRSKEYHISLKLVESSQRYLSAEEKTLAAELIELIETKRNIDYQESSQRLLKLWLFVHIPVTYSMLILAFFHAYYAFQFGGRF